MTASCASAPCQQPLNRFPGSPAVKRTPFHWTNYPSQQSTSLWLSAGNRYYFEALSKTGGSNSAPGLRIFPGHLEVGWTGPGLPGTNVIDGAFLSPIDLDYPPTFADEAIALPITTADGTVVTTLAAQASTADTLSYKLPFRKCQ